MSRIRCFALLLILFTLAACEKNPPAAPPARVDPPAQRPAAPVEETSPVETPVSVDSVPPAEPPPAKKPAPQAPAKAPAPAVKNTPPAPLDLSLHTHVFDPLQPLEPLLDLSTPFLPPLFEEKTEPSSPFQLHGKLITNERDDDYFESIEGAQLQFEFRQ
jgi:predicted small lipoprotein YifL